MANYIYIQNYANNGRVGINKNIFYYLVENTLSKFKGIDISLKESKRKKKIILHDQIQTSITGGILHVSLSVDVSKKENVVEITQNIQKEITNSLLCFTEQVPFDVRIKVISLY